MTTETDDLTEFALRLTAVRIAYGEDTGRDGLSQRDFAAELRTDVTALAACERGEAQPTVALLTAIHRVTGISLDYLIADYAPK